MARLVPAPNIQANLRPARDRHASMDRLLIPSAVRIKVGPEDRGTFPRLERHAFLGRLPTLDELAPVLTWRRLDAREIRAAAGAFG